MAPTTRQLQQQLADERAALEELRAELEQLRGRRREQPPPPPSHPPPPVRLAAFWETQPAAWFAQAEVALEGLDEAAKFAAVVRHLGEAQAAHVTDLLTSPPAENPFTVLKLKLLERLAGSPEQRLNELLSPDSDLGDQRPSALLRHMRSLAGDTVGDNLLRQLWAQRLPSLTRAVLAGQPTLALDAAASLADSVTEAGASPRPAVCAAAAPAAAAPEVARLAECMEALTQQVAALSARSEDRRRDRPQPRPSTSHHNPDWCWFHNEFGARASKCRAPCSYQKGNGAGGGQ